jgi:hypothetical protein
MVPQKIRISELRKGRSAVMFQHDREKDVSLRWSKIHSLAGFGIFEVFVL